jgi:hypothetical protein
LLTFRPPPVGWWEVFDRSGLHKFTPFRTTVIILLAAVLFAALMAAGNFVTNNIQVQRTAKAWLYRTGDPTHTKVADYGGGSETTSLFDREPRGSHVRFPPNPVPGLTTHVDWTEHIVVRRPNLVEYTVYPSTIIFFFICGWIIYRHGWLNLLLHLNLALSASDRDAARRAASPLSLIFIALSFWMIVFLLLLLLFYRVINFPVWGFIFITIFILSYPSALLLRTLRADAAGHVFPHRPIAGFLIAGAALLHIGLLAITIAIAKALVRIFSSA